MSTEESLAERKRKRLEAWKLRRKKAEGQRISQQQTAISIPVVKPIKLQLPLKLDRPKANNKKSIVVKSNNVFDFTGEDDEMEEEAVDASRKRLPVFEASSLTGQADLDPTRTGKRGKWDVPGQASAQGSGESRGASGTDTLDRFMYELNAGEAPPSMRPGTKSKTSINEESIVLPEERGAVRQKLGSELPKTADSQVSHCLTGRSPFAVLGAPAVFGESNRFFLRFDCFF